MTNQVVMQRKELAVSIIQQLSYTSARISKCAEEIEQCVSLLFEDIIQSKNEDIKKEIARYNHNIQKTKDINAAMMTEMNKWYAYIKEPVNLGNILFPLRFHLRNKQLNRRMDEYNKTIIKLNIENRLIKEKMAILENDLHCEAVQASKHNATTTQYQQLITIKSSLIDELKYLLQSIPELCPVHAGTTDLDSLIARLMTP